MITEFLISVGAAAPIVDTIDLQPDSAGVGELACIFYFFLSCVDDFK